MKTLNMTVLVATLLVAIFLAHNVGNAQNTLPNVTPIVLPEVKPNTIADTTAIVLPNIPPVTLTNTLPRVSLTITALGPNLVEVTVRGNPGLTYGLEESRDLKQWREIQHTSIPLSGRKTLTILPTESDGGRFFRLKR